MQPEEAGSPDSRIVRASRGHLYFRGVKNGDVLIISNNTHRMSRNVDELGTMSIVEGHMHPKDDAVIPVA